MEIERHPFAPFLPPEARILFLGSFPPQAKRWSMSSTSRAYPLALEKKAAAYSRLFGRESISNSSIQPPVSSSCVR